MTEEKPDKEKETPKKRRGRPPKTQLEKKKAPGKPGRPPGTAAIMNQYKARMLASPKSEKVLEAIYDAALDPDNKNQSAAWKLIMDRMLPVRMFEQEVEKGSGRSQIQINISTTDGKVNIDGKTSSDPDEAIDAEFTAVPSTITSSDSSREPED